MTNAELITGLRECARTGDCSKCKLHEEYSYDMCSLKLLIATADALEAAEKRIAELEADKKILIKVIKDKSDFHATKDAMRIAELDAQMPKDGVWRKIAQNDDGTSDYECSACLGIIENVPDDDEHPLCSFCSLCGARMKDHADGEKK